MFLTMGRRLCQILNPFDCFSGKHENCVGDCIPRDVTPGVKKEMQELKRRLREKIDL